MKGKTSKSSAPGMLTRATYGSRKGKEHKDSKIILIAYSAEVLVSTETHREVSKTKEVEAPSLFTTPTHIVLQQVDSIGLKSEISIPGLIQAFES